MEFLKASLQDEEETRVTDDEILSLAEEMRFRYMGREVGAIEIRRWLEQFENTSHQRTMFKLLSGLRFYDENAIREKARVAFGIVEREMRTLIQEGLHRRRDILVSSLDESLAKSGSNYAKLFAQENRIFHEYVKPLEALKRRFPTDGGIQRLVFVDDFSGTGQTIIDGLKENLEILHRANSEGIRVIIIVLVGFQEALQRVDRFISQNRLDAKVEFCEELDSGDRAFSEDSTIFPDPTEREKAKQIAEGMGVQLEKKHPLGYKDSQAAVVFYQSCPNNTLPILWSTNKDWKPLFRRM